MPGSALVLGSINAKEQIMARKIKRTAKRRASARKPARKKVSARKVAKKQIRRAKTVGKTVRAAVKSARRKTAAATKAGKGIVRRAVEAIAQVAAPLLPGSTDEKPKDD